jgi:hypothetical protein
MNSEERIMRCKIEGSWTTKDMIESLSSFRDLYNIRLGLQVVAEDSRDLEEIFYELQHFPPFRKRLKRRRLHPLLIDTLLSGYGIGVVDPSRLQTLVLPHEELKVRRIEYASPGFKDLAGLGDIVGHVKDFTLELIKHFSTRTNRNLKDEEQEIHNQALRIQNARSFVALAKECGFEDAEMRKLVLGVDSKQGPLIQLIENGKIQDVKMLDEKNENKG